MREAIDRPRLRSLLTIGLEKPLTPVVVPTDYGKTAFVGSWLAAEALPAVGQPAPALVNSPVKPPASLLADVLINDLSGSRRRGRLKVSLPRWFSGRSRLANCRHTYDNR
jgi:hypothetical protein